MNFKTEWLIWLWQAAMNYAAGKPMGKIAMLRQAMVKQFIYRGRLHLNNACNGNLTANAT